MTRKKRLLSATLSVSFALLCTGPVSADDSRLEVTAHCDRVVGPGRVLCEVSAKPTRGRLVWSDVLVVRAPEFAQPLRSRVVAVLGTSSAAATARLALVATRAGQGKLELLVRGVICQDTNAAQGCKAVTEALSALLQVGPQPAPAP